MIAVTGKWRPQFSAALKPQKADLVIVANYPRKKERKKEREREKERVRDRKIDR